MVFCKSGQTDKISLQVGQPHKKRRPELHPVFSALKLFEIEFCEGGIEDISEGGLLVGGEVAEDEIDIAEFRTNFGIVGAEAEAREILCAEMSGDGF